MLVHVPPNHHTLLVPVMFMVISFPDAPPPRGASPPLAPGSTGFNVVDERDAALRPAAVCHVSTVENARKPSDSLRKNHVES